MDEARKTKITTGVVWGTFGLISVSVVIALVLPPPDSWRGNWFDYHVPLVMTFLFADTFIGAAALFVFNLGVYRARLKIAYSAIALSIVLDAVGAVGTAVVIAQNLWNDSEPMFYYGLPFLLSGVASCTGALILARIVGTGIKRGTVVALVILLGALSYLVTLLPHPESQLPEWIYDFANVSLFLGGLLGVMAGYIVMKVKGSIGIHYVNALAWLSIGLASGGATAIFVAIRGMKTNEQGDPVILALSVVALLSGLAFLRAGYVFAKLKDY